MRPLAACCCLLLLSAAAAAADDPVGFAVDDFALLDHEGRWFQLGAQGDVPVVVLYVHGVGCPIVRANVHQLQELARRPRYAREVRFVMLNASPQDARADLQEEVARIGITLPILDDEAQIVAESLGVTRTGEALVIRTEDRQVLWRGPVDDRLDYGTQKPVATRHYLAEALDAVLAGREPPADTPAAKGCAITFTQPRDRHRVDYAEHVVPILRDSCIECHRPGGIGPWAMKSYDKVHGWSAMIGEVVRTRRMPPWNADPAHGEFANDMSLTPEEVRTLVHWVEQGAPRGDGPDPLAADPPRRSDGWPLGEPDLVVDLPEQQVPATGVLPYRHHSQSVTLPRDVWVRAVHLRPSNEAVLHHAFAWLENDPTSDVAATDLDQRMQRLLEAAERLGQRGDLPPDAHQRLERLQRRGDRTGLTDFFASYVPGAGPNDFPPGTGKPVPRQARFRFQFHYTTTGYATTDRPQMALYFHDRRPRREVQVTSAFNLRFVIPPGEREVPVSASRSFERDVVLYAFSPHMHYRGSRMRYVAHYPNGERETLLSVPRYDMDWQLTYHLARPKPIPAGTRIVVEGAFDNSPYNPFNPDPTQRVRFGEQSWDEMFIGYLVYAAR